MCQGVLPSVIITVNTSTPPDVMVSRHFVLLHVDDQRSNDVGK